MKGLELQPTNEDKEEEVVSKSAPCIYMHLHVSSPAPRLPAHSAYAAFTKAFLGTKTFGHFPRLRSLYVIWRQRQFFRAPFLPLGGHFCISIPAACPLSPSCPLGIWGPLDELGRAECHPYNKVISHHGHAWRRNGDAVRRCDAGAVHKYVTYRNITRHESKFDRF